MSFSVHGLQAKEPYSVMKDNRSDGGKMARKSFGLPHEKNTETRRRQVETKHQVDKGFVTKHRETQQLKMARKRCCHAPLEQNLFKLNV